MSEEEVPVGPQEQKGVFAASQPASEERKSPSSIPNRITLAQTSRSSSFNDAELQVMKITTGNPTVELITGTIEFHRTKSFEAEEQPANAERGCLLCVMNIPSFMSNYDFIHFLGSHESVAIYVRIIRNQVSKAYMALILFSEQHQTDIFVEEYNGRLFGSLSDEKCIVNYVTRLDLCNKTCIYPLADPVDIPVCPVCLDRMEPSHGCVLVTICNHLFHTHCLTSWQDNTCPVCRYSQEPEENTNMCMDCGMDSDLWMCIICGHLGCGRYQNGHSLKHFESTRHTYSLELSSQKVWDYSGDGYVHRLIQNKADGKLVETGDPSAPFQALVRLGQGDQAKLEEITADYNQLLISQLDAQRAWYEEQVEKLKEQQEHEVKKLQAEINYFLSETLKATEKLDKEKRANEKKLHQLQEKYKKEIGEGDFMKQIYSSSVVTQKEWQERYEQLERKMHDVEAPRYKKVAELEQQVNELMKALDGSSGAGAHSPVVEERPTTEEKESPSKPRRTKKKGG